MSPTSPEASEDEPTGIGSNHDLITGGDGSVTSPTGSGKSGTDGEGKDGDDTLPTLPVQKRRRVTRACDECRRKKIKCDGKQPCTHCSVYSYECTYDKPSNRRRNPAPQYIEALENRLQRAESMLRKYVPNVDLSDPDLDPAVKQEFRNRELARSQAAKLKQPHSGGETDGEEGQIMSMIESIGQLDLDDKGGWDFHGASSGAVFLRRMKEHFRGMLGPQEKVPFLPRPERPPGLMHIDSPQSGASSPFESTSSLSLELPSKEEIKDLCYYSLNCATCLIRLVHLPSFYKQLDVVYEKTYDTLEREEYHFLALLYAIMALGCMYRNLDPEKPQKLAYREALQEGLRYYNCAKSVLRDLAECRDVTSLQALVFMILFLQATSNLSACYAFLGIALRSALRMGLHRHIEHHMLSPIEQETRRRVFYVIRQMDIYVSTLLGFPLLLRSEDFDQRYPSEIDDAYITNEGLRPPPNGTPSLFQAFNAHTRLMEILAKIVRHVYPTQGLDQTAPLSGKGSNAHNTTYIISYSRIREIENDLHEWYENLPETWRPSADGPVEVVRIRHLLRFAYAHVQLVLYRPFLHYVSPRLSRGKNVDDLSYACAAAAISVSRNIVHIGIEIRKQGVLIGPYWFMLYTEFFAVLSLVFYATENPQKNGTSEVLADAIAGRNMIADLVDASLAAARVTKALNFFQVLFEELPKQMDLPFPRQASKKRPMTSKDEAPSLSNVQRRSDELPHQARSLSGASIPPSVASRASYDGASLPGSGFHPEAFPASLQDLLPLDLTSRATPDSTSTAGTGIHQGPGYATNQNPSSASLNKLDALMFPSEDPFAYPNQPMMELGLQQKIGQETGMQGQGHHDTSQFFMPGPFDDVESQLLGQMPPFMLDQAQHGLEMPMPMYASNEGGHQGHPSSSNAAPAPAGQASQQNRAEQLRRQQQQIMAAQRFRTDWTAYGRGAGGFHGI